MEWDIYKINKDLAVRLFETEIKAGLKDVKQYDNIDAEAFLNAADMFEVTEMPSGNGNLWAKFGNSGYFMDNIKGFTDKYVPILKKDKLVQIIRKGG